MATAEMQHASDSKHCRRCGAAYVYDAIYLGPSRRLPLPDLRPAPARAGRRRPMSIAAARDPQRHASCSTPGAARARSSSPSPASTTSTTPWARRRCAWGSGVSLETIAAGLAAVSPAFGRAERVTIGAQELSILLIKNPAGANEILRTLVLEPDELDLLAILNDRTADGRDISWIWDADFEMLAGRVAPRHLRRDPRRRAGPAPEVRRPAAPSGSPSSPPLGAALDAALAASPDGRLFALPTYTALLELRSRASAPRPRRRVLVTRDRGGAAMTKAIWHDLECGSYTADLMFWRALAREASAARCSTSAPGPGAPRSSSPARATRWWPSTATTSCWRSCASAPRASR